ncbi:MAG: transposase [Flammeovirgaceae bacterium]|nr:MAG: transposase [Flammeovirgaceae bacterium]
MQPRIQFLVVYVIFALPGLAQTPFEITDDVEERNFMPYELSYFIDPTNKLSFIEISSPEYSNRFQTHTNYQNIDFQVNAAYWIRLPIRTSSDSKRTWLLEFYDQTIDHIEAFVPMTGGAYRIVHLGDQQPFSKRFFHHKNFEIQIDTQRDTLMVFYFRVQSHEFADLRIALRSVNRFVYYALNEYFLFGTFYGMILIIALYNFLVYLGIREIKNIYYICYILSVAGYAMSLDGIGFQYLWPEHPYWNNYAVGIFLYSLIIWALIFTRKFLSTRANAPKLDKVIKLVMIIRSVIFVTELFFFPQFLTYRNLDILPLSLIFYTGITVWRNGYKPARFFVIAYGILFTGFFLRMLVYFNVLPFTIASHYSLHFAFVLEMLFLTFALGDRIRILKDMRDRALRRIIHQHELNMQLKDKVNRELEEKVLARTVELDAKNKELAESNQKLLQQAEKLNRINSMLDLDNWKLKSSIKEVLNERLQEKTMDYTQFKTLYPDKLACYRFLENLKWEKGFRCKRCSNEKYFAGTAKFARRCSRCGYNESITAFTIFQGIKFPIEKAFYIAYLTVTGKRDSTLEFLASMLDLGTNTVWAFKTKVNNRILELEKNHKRPLVSRWEEVILEDSKRRSKSSKPKPKTIAKTG